MQLTHLLLATLSLSVALPAFAADGGPKKAPMTELVTEWGAAIDPEDVWDEYPRPQLAREGWECLNGMWDYAVTSKDQAETPREWNGQILTPFCLESSLGGVQRMLLADEALWYHRTFEVDPSKGKTTLLNFEAVDYECWVTVNGEEVGHHKGGNTPFAIDVTDVVRQGENELVVRVLDATDGYQLRGKQTNKPHGIWYTQVSGIWQTVWLEQVGEAWIEELDVETDPQAGTITVTATLAGDAAGKTVRVEAFDDDQTVAEGSASEGAIELTIPDVKLWSPASPHLYDLKVTLSDGDEACDEVRSYAGVRSVGTTKDADGNHRFTLNGETVFHWGPLDQGWWPDGLLTPPSDEAMLSDIEFLKQAGFNMIRKHIKIEPRRYYYHCDRLGMMVWQDHVSGGPSPEWTRLRPDPSDADWPDDEHEQFMLELERMIDLLEPHPSIVVWVPFNEAWGQHRTVAVGEWTVARDPSRPINIASGGNFWPAGDVVDAHQYPHPGFPFNRGEGGRFDGFVKVVGEFGGHGYPVTDHLWDAKTRNWGYGDLPKNEAEYHERYVVSIEKLKELRSKGIAAGVYTQTTDVEGEINGLMTYDRKVIKIDADELAEIHQKLLAPLTETAAPAKATAE